MSISTPSRIVVLSPNWLGDAVMSLPALSDVRRAWPDAHLGVAGRRSIAPLFEAAPIVDEVLPLDGHGAPGDRRLAADADRLRAGRFDVALLLPNSFASAWLARQAGIAGRWGYRGDFRRALLTRAVPRPSRRGHQAEYYQGLVRALGFGQRLRPARGAGGERGEAEPSSASAEGPTRSDKSPLVRVSDGATARAQEMLASRGWRPDAPLVGIAPGAAYGHAKRWPPARFAAVVRALAVDGVRAVVVGSAADVEAVRAIERALGADSRSLGWIDLAGRTDLATLMGVLAACRALVTNDSGAMHLAAALGVPVTAMFGPTDERTTAPLVMGGDAARAHAVLATSVWCRPCMLRECPIDHRCMTRISTDDVLEKVRRQIA